MISTNDQQDMHADQFRQKSEVVTITHQFSIAALLKQAKCVNIHPIHVLVQSAPAVLAPIKILVRHARQNYGRRRARCDVTHVIVTLLLLLLLLGAVHVQRQELIDRHHGHAPDWYLTRATRTGRLLLLLRDVRWWRFCTSTSHTQCTHARAITTAISVDFVIRTGHKNPYALFAEYDTTYLNLSFN